MMRADKHAMDGADTPGARSASASASMLQPMEAVDCAFRRGELLGRDAGRCQAAVLNDHANLGLRRDTCANIYLGAQYPVAAG